MIRIAHEAPNAIFQEVQKRTDYDYFLIHLLLESQAYMTNYQNSRLAGREIILDNSIFELGTAFDSKQYAEWIEKLTPTWYILPDSLENAKQTVANAQLFMHKYPSLPGGVIGVLQGKTYEEIVWCYDNLCAFDVDMIAVSFDYSLYEEWYPSLNKLEAWAVGRLKLLLRLSQEWSFRRDMPIHLLGCALPQQFRNYKLLVESGLNIYSCDTSNPVVAGLKGLRYHENGLVDKPSQKLFELIDTVPDTVQMSDILHNIELFREFTNG